MKIAVKRVLLFAVIGCALVTAGCQEPPPPAVPQLLVGTWITSAESHAGRTLQITPTTVAFDQGDKSEYCAIVEVGQEPYGNGSTLYTISYDSAAGEEYLLSVVYDPAGGGVLRFMNQPELVFTRSET